MINTKYLALTSVIVCLNLLVSFASVADSNKQQKNAFQAPEMQVKCHVVYQGGGDDIRVVIGEFGKPEQAIGFFQGREVSNYNGNKTKSIFLVKECVEAKNEFKGATAKQLDKNKLH